MRGHAPVFDDVLVSESPLQGQLGKVIDAAQLLETHDAIAGNAVAEHDDARQHLGYVYMDMYVCVCVCVCVYIYIYIDR